MNEEQAKREDKALGNKLDDALLQKIALDNLYKPVLGTAETTFEWSFLESLTER
jgi:hypothetical protein